MTDSPRDPRFTVPTKAEGLTGKERVKVPEILLRGLVKPSRSPQEIARRAFIRGMVIGISFEPGGEDDTSL